MIRVFFVLCSSGKLLRDVYSQIYFDVSPGNGRQASSEKQKILCQLLYFCCSHSGLVFRPEFCFSDEAWRPLPGETSK